MFDRGNCYIYFIDGSASKSDKVHQTLNITATGNVIVGSHNIMFGCNDKRTESSEDSDIERTSDGEESVGSAQGSMRMHNLKEPLLKMNATERMVRPKSFRHYQWS